MLGFGRRRDPAASEQRRRVEAWVRGELTGGEPAHGADAADTLVKVNEIACPDPACPGWETVILLMPPGQRTRALKIAKPLSEVALEDVAAALRAT